MTELVDTSVWVEFLRGSASRATSYLEERLGREEPRLAVTEPVLMEVLAGAGPGSVDRLEHLLHSQELLTVDAALDYHLAADLYRRVRATGRTVRSLNDCLIAAVALRHDATVAHRDADFVVIAQVTALRLVTLS